MSRSHDAIIGSGIVGIFALAGCLAVFAVGALGSTESRPEPQSIAVAASILLKGQPCSLLEWPNYDQSCQFDERQHAGEMRTVRIIAVR